MLGYSDLEHALRQVGVYTATTGRWGDEYAQLVKEKLESAVQTWRNKPTFRTTTQVSGTYYSDIRVMPEGAGARIFRFVNWGTRPHWIRPRWNNAGGKLAFNTKFSPKSTPNSLRASAGFSGPPVAFAREVWHPGTEPRNFHIEAGRQSQAEGSARVIERIMDRWGSRL